jgi:cytochrome c peroxidase
LITCKYADVGKVKRPILHGFAARAPYFHNGSAATLEDVVNFYNQRFSIGFTDQEKGGRGNVFERALNSAVRVSARLLGRS